MIAKSCAAANRFHIAWLTTLVNWCTHPAQLVLNLEIISFVATWGAETHLLLHTVWQENGSESVRTMKNFEINALQHVDSANVHRTRTVPKGKHVDIQRIIPAVLIIQMDTTDMDAKNTNITVTGIQALGMRISRQLVKQRAIHANLKHRFIADLAYRLMIVINAISNMENAKGIAS